jgi:UDP-glucose 4-epimerase
VDALTEKNFEVHVIDNLVNGKRENINPVAVFHKVDIRDFEKIKPLFEGAKFVFHLAALPRVQYSIENPQITHDTNVNGTLNVLIAARDNEVRRVIYSSSSSVYGNQKKLPLRETMKPMPISPYGLQKYIGELQCRLFSQIYGLETISLRYFNVYGSRAPFDGAYALVIGKFLVQRKRGEPLTIVPNGKQSRDFTYVDDVVWANILAAESPKVGKGEAVNIGGGKKHSVLEVADIIGGPTVFIEPRLEPKHTLASIKMAKRLLGWEPEISLERGIEILKKTNELIYSQP